MGVPSFYRWLVGRYPKIMVKAVEEAGEDVDASLPNPNGMEFDNLYLDMNGIVHPCFHPEDQVTQPSSPSLAYTTPTTLEEVFKAIFDYVDRIFRIVRPRNLLYMAIDGVAPRAKMNRQRSGRFMTAKYFEIAEAEEERLRMEFEGVGKTVLPRQEHEISDSNIITPGTVFMEKLSKALEFYIRSRLSSDPGWKSIKVILSDANVPGEGEHKIMEFIRVQRNLPGYNPNLRHCLYGLDADLIMLALATHEIHFSILREDVVLKEKQNEVCLSKEVKIRQYKKNNEAKGRVFPKKTYQFLNIWTLREYLELDMNIPDAPFKIDTERIIDDFIFICLFTGNDFLPHLPSLEICEGAIDLLIYVYKKIIKTMGGYIVDMSKIRDKKAAYLKVKRLERFILEVGSYEDRIFDKRSRLQQKKLQRLLCERLEEEKDGNEIDDPKYNVEYGVRNEVAEPNNGAYKFSVHNDSCSTFRSLETISKSFKEICNVSPRQTVLTMGHDGNDVIENTKELKQKLKDFLHDKTDFFKSGALQNDKVKLGSPGWKSRYYREKFSAENSEEIENTWRSVVEKYVEGLCWVLHYYFARVCSWSWYYPFHYGPFASDLKGLCCSRIKFKLGCPFKPFEQLMVVLPPKSSHALPKVYRPLMNSKDSKIIDFYPSDFDVDMDGKRFLWQGVCKLPFIKEEVLLVETKILESELEVDEMERNSFRNCKIFVRDCQDLGFQMSSIHTSAKCTTEQSNRKEPIDVVSCGINGFLCPRDDFLGHHRFQSPIEGMKDIMKDNSISADFIDPEWHEHIPRLLENVNMPEKTITEDDIAEVKLWHEYEGSRPPQIYNQQRYATKVESATHLKPAQETWKRAGSGWGSIGRGRGFVAEAPAISPGHEANDSNQARSFGRGHGSFRMDAIIQRGNATERLRGNSTFGGYQSGKGASKWSRGDACVDWRPRRGPEVAVCRNARDHGRGWSMSSAPHANRWNGESSNREDRTRW